MRAYSKILKTDLIENCQLLPSNQIALSFKLVCSFSPLKHKKLKEIFDQKLKEIIIRSLYERSKPHYRWKIIYIYIYIWKMLWNLFLSIVGTSWVFPHSVLHTLLAWQGAAVGKKRKRIWLAAPLCLFWTLWRARNRLVFENEGTTDQKIKANFVSNL